MIEITSFIIGLISAIIASFSVKFIKGIRSEKNYIMKNSKGNSVEIEINKNDSVKDIRFHIEEAIRYERLIEKILADLNIEFKVQNNREYQDCDILIYNKTDNIKVEIKSHSRPLQVKTISNIINRCTESNDSLLIISKSGFSKSTYNYIKTVQKKVFLIDGEKDNLKKEILSIISKLNRHII